MAKRSFTAALLLTASLLAPGFSSVYAGQDEQQATAYCLAVTGGEPEAMAACVAEQLTINEVDKCLFSPDSDDCFGPNNEFRKLGRELKLPW